MFLLRWLWVYKKMYKVCWKNIYKVYKIYINIRVWLILLFTAKTSTERIKKLNPRSSALYKIFTTHSLIIKLSKHVSSVMADMLGTICENAYRAIRITTMCLGFCAIYHTGEIWCRKYQAYPITNVMKPIEMFKKSQDGGNLNSFLFIYR